MGVSTHTLEQVKAADRDFRRLHCVWTDFPDANQRKTRTRSLVRGFCGRRAKLPPKPLVAIGGITLESGAPEVYRAGADSLAVIRDLICAASPGCNSSEYLEVAASAASR